MRRIAHVAAPPALVRRIFHDVEDWPSWMPGMTSCHVIGEAGVDATAERRRVAVSQNVLGRDWKQTAEMRFDDRSVKVRTLDGWLRWTAVWGFTAPVDGDGTTLSLELETEAGIFGLANRRLFFAMSERRFDDTVAAVTRRASTLNARRRTAELRRPVEGRRLVVVYETAQGLEVWYQGRRYVADSGSRSS